MYIAQEFKKINILPTKEGFIPSLKEMPQALTADVEVFGVSREDALKDRGDGGAVRPQQKVDMVGHKAVRVEFERREGFGFCQDVQKHPPILLGKKDFLPAVAASHNVVESAGKMYAGSTRHTESTSKETNNSKTPISLSLTPSFIVDAGRRIGVDKKMDSLTRYTVIADDAGNLVTAFPGLPDIKRFDVPWIELHTKIGKLK